MLQKHVILYGEAVRGWFFQARKSDGEKCLPRVENKLSSLDQYYRNELQFVVHIVHTSNVVFLLLYANAAGESFYEVIF